MHNWSILLLTMLFAVSTSTTNPELEKTVTITCGTDFLHERELQNNNSYQQQHQAIERQISQYIGTGIGSAQPTEQKGLATYTLPVVVHIIHNNGAENISDATVIQGIADLNAAFENTGYYDQGTGVNTQFEFCLARRDPLGNATTGITRDVSLLTEMTMETEDIDVKNLNRWSPTEYINIWLVKEICSQSSGCGVAGYAFFPGAHGTSVDGIMNEARYFGSSAGNSTIHTHEMGHYLGLYHTFQGSCTNNDCLTDGDRVCDTPPDQSKAAVPCSGTANTCSTDANSGFPSDQNDLFINYMDYGNRFCYSMFTQGQTDRMDFFINTTRSSLLASQACQAPCLSNITADYLVFTNTANVGDNLTFTNLSNGATTYQWLINGVPFSNATSPNYNFNTAGVFTITLQATNADPNCYDEYSLDITVTCAVEANFSASYLYPEPGQQVNFNNTSVNATTYTWIIDNTTFATTINSSYTFPNTGSYEICVEAGNGLCSDMFCRVVFVYLDSTGCPTPCQEICANGIDDDEDGYIDNYDGDCREAEDCVTNNIDQNFSSRLAWESSVDRANVSSTPIVANLNPSEGNLPEIIIPTSDNVVSVGAQYDLLIFQGDGSDLNNPRSLSITTGYDPYPSNSPVVGDINRDGIPEMALVCFDRRIRVYTNFSATNPDVMDEMVVSSGLVDHTENRAFLADFDGDGISEIYVGNDVYKFDFSNPAAPTLTKILIGVGDSGKLNRAGTFSENTVAADLLSVANCNGDPDCAGLEIAAGSVIYSVDVSTTDGDGYEIKVQKDFNILQNTSTYNDGYTTVADVDLDGIMDVIVSGSRAPATNGVYIWNKNGLVDFLVLANPRVGAITSVANVYDDRLEGFALDFPEIILAIENKVVCLNLNKASITPLIPYWWDLVTQDASGVTGVTVFDFNGDNIKEIVYRDELNLRILYGGPTPFPAGVDPSRNWSSFVAGSGTFDDHPIVADVDLDGQAEIVVPSYTFSGTNTPPSDYRGRLRVFESDLSIGDPWMSARDIWNQYNYFVVNINDDLTLPINQQLHHLEFPATGSGSRPYNTFLAQIPLLDENFTPFLPVADVALTVDSVACDQGSFNIYFEICNLQGVTFPEFAPITFYDSDPTASNATAISSTLLIPEVPRDSCINSVLIIPAVYNTPIFMVINDDASLAPIFDLSTDFPVTNILECDFTNNMDSFNFDYNQATLDLGPDQLVCQNGVFNLDAGSGFTSYLWFDGSTESTYTAFAPGNYWVDVWDACGYLQSDTIRIEEDQATVFDIPDSTFCDGNSISITVNGFDDYQWFPDDGSIDCMNCPTVIITPLTDSIYTLVASTSNGCISIDSFKITPGGSNTTRDTLYICEGNSALIFGNMETLAADYSETYSSPGLCDSTHITTLLLNENPITSILATDASCGANNGSATATASNGNGTYFYLWNNNQTTATIQGLNTGSYYLTVTDGNGCTSTASTQVGQGVVLQVSSQVTTAINCNGNSTGAATATALNGSSPFTYEWSNASQGQTLQNVPAGSYTVTITDTNNCSNTSEVILTEPTALTNNFTLGNAACSGNSGGSITSNVLGGIAPYTFEWSNNFVETTGGSSTISALPTGNYSLTITDANNCTLVNDVSIVNQEPLSFLSDLSPVSCLGGNDGAATITPTGGSAPYTVIWPNNQLGNTVNNLLADVYIITITDANSCQLNANLTITEPATAVSLTLSSSDASCFGENDGTATVVATGGTPSYTYAWNNGATEPTAFDLDAGNYTVTVSDQNGCKAVSIINVTQPPVLSAQANSTAVTCEGDENGSLLLTSIVGGIPPYTFSLDGSIFQVDSLFPNLAAGAYEIQVKDDYDCIFTLQATVAAGQSLVIAIDLGESISIPLGDSVTLETTLSPSTAPVTYTWFPPDALSCTNCPEPTLLPLADALYTVSVVDTTTGCTASDQILVTVEKNQNIFIPNVFTPNDDGINDQFFIYGGQDVALVRQFQIWDRWGELIYQAAYFPVNTPNFGWDGTFRGKRMNPSVLVYVAEVEFIDGEVRIYKGDFTLLY